MGELLWRVKGSSWRRRRLRNWAAARATTVSVRDRRRAEIIVLSAQGLTQQRIAEQLGISRLAVNRWVGRFALHRLDG
jgi:DNA-binding NarL/FixJ family response regulator